MNTKNQKVRGAVEVGDVVEIQTRYWGTQKAVVTKVTRTPWCVGGSHFEAWSQVNGGLTHLVGIFGNNWKLVKAAA